MPDPAITLSTCCVLLFFYNTVLLNVFSQAQKPAQEHVKTHGNTHSKKFFWSPITIKMMAMGLELSLVLEWAPNK